ncbi:MAG: asparagine synthase (glutamine-hydrolyzing) [Saprospiraceae bacterium]
MCGISAIINKNNTNVKSEDIKFITDLVFHRGPDGEGYYFGSNFAFGHRRLSIIDLSKNANQPMKYNDDYVITFNGAIYNYKEIKSELISAGYDFNSNSDTEVILASYAHWGYDCVDHFNGMWSFAIFDKEKNILFCSRDRFGIKPFYYLNDDHNFIIGSEIRQLLPHLQSRESNHQIIIDYLVTGILEHTNETFFRNILKLPASHNLIYDLNTHKFKIERYYDIKTNCDDKNESFEKVKSDLQGKLFDSVALRLRSDVKIGACLSGGIDSSLITTFSSQLYNENDKLISIHAKTTEAEHDESLFARQVAKELDIKLIISEPSKNEFIENIEKIVEIQEEPFGSPGIFMQYFIFNEAKKSGIKVMLDGQGGDEVFLGYEKYFPAYFREINRKKGFLSMIKEIYLANRNNEKMGIKSLFTFILGTRYPKIRKLAYRKRVSFLKQYNDNFDFLNKFSNSYTSIPELQKLELNQTMLPELLRYEDKNSMYNSIESRLPFLDYNIVEFSLNQNSDFKIHSGWTKYILRSLLADNISENIAWRKKKNNFNAPTETWLNSIKSTMIEEISNSNILEKLCDKKILLKKYDNINLIVKWRLYNIALWERIFKIEI